MAASLTSSSSGQDLTQGSIVRELWALAWPMMLSVFFYTLYNVVDAVWVSRLSDEAIAAVSISQITLFVMVSLSMGITVGSGVLMAMNIGAKNKIGAERVLGQSFVLAAGSALVFTMLSMLFRDQLLTASGATGLIFDPAKEYFTITSAGSVLFFILFNIMFAFNAQGDTLTLTKLFAISTLVNLVMDPVLIFGYLGFPALGISGAAYATLISQAVFISIAIHSLASPARQIRFQFSNLRTRWESVREVFKIGIPASLTQVINPLGLAALMYLVGYAFDEPGAVAFSIGNRVEFLGFLPAVGFGFAALALIGQSIGARNLPRAREAFGKALLFAAGGATGLGLVAVIFASQITAIFTDDPLVTGYSLSYIWTVGLSFGLLAATMVEANAFQSIGRSWPGFWIVFTRLVIVTLPLGYVLTQVFEMPIQGIWLSIVTGNLVAAVLGYFWITRTLAALKLDDIPLRQSSASQMPQ